MFVIPCKYNSQSLIDECVESIHNFHINEKILIVDSDSEDISYINKFNHIENLIVSNKKNKNFEFGALKIAFDEYPNEKKYILVHDSVIFKKSISNFINDNNCYSFLYFHENMTGEKEVLKMNEIISKTNYNFNNINVVGCLGSMCIITNQIMNNLKKNKIFEFFSPIDKFDSQMSERIIGLCLQQEECDLIKYSIEGDYLAQVNKLLNDDLKFIKKIFKGRK